METPDDIESSRRQGGRAGPGARDQQRGGQPATADRAAQLRVGDVLHNFNLDGFDSLYPRYAGGRPPTFTLAQRRQIKQVALSRPQDHDLPFSTWSLAKLADFLVAEGWSMTSAMRAFGSCSARRACPFK